MTYSVNLNIFEASEDTFKNINFLIKAFAEDIILKELTF